MYCLFILLALLSFSFGMPSDRPMEDPLWRDYKLKFGKFYSHEHEETGRYFIWRQHMKEIHEHNKAGKSYKKGMNNFTDMTHEEFRKQMGGCFKLPKHIIEGNITEGSAFIPPANVKIPEYVNWVEEGYVTDVKNQGQCGSCWSFSSTGAIEGQTMRKTGRLPSLSEQNLVDCTRSYGNAGCHGGWMDNAFKYVRDNNGIDSESGYPYYARELGYCYFNKQYVTADTTGFVDIPQGDEDALKIAVATIGPISVAIDATHRSFQTYRSGIYFESQCGNGLENLDHAVLVVGYGRTEDDYDYWLVKNSWGTSWGDQGYIKMARNYDNQCGVATKASYPLV